MIARALREAVGTFCAVVWLLRLARVHQTHDPPEVTGCIFCHAHALAMEAARGPYGSRTPCSLHPSEPAGACLVCDFPHRYRGVRG